MLGIKSHLFRVWIESVEGSELEFAVSEEDEEVGTVALLDLLQHPPPGVLVDLARQHHVLHRVHDDGPVGLTDGLTVQPGRAWTSIFVSWVIYFDNFYSLN